ncbi:hypothetical protein BH23GEM9_BH23GEM9_12560 [soil metagenome]
MVTLASLWLPILLSTIAVFVLSALVWTVLHIHDSEWPPLPAEDRVTQALKEANVAPGQYYFPAAAKNAAKDPAAAEFVRTNPGGYVYVSSENAKQMGRSIGLAVVFNFAVTIVVAYLASRTVAPGAHYLEVFRVVGTAGWLAYGAAHFPYAIWFSHSWAAAWKQLVEAFVYALVMAGIFGWLWPS